MNIEFSIWIASKTRMAHLNKSLFLPAIPRVGEYMKFTNRTVGDYFSWRVTQVTYSENGKIEIWTELLENIDERGYSFEEESEFDEYLSSYIEEGWLCERGPKENTLFRNATA